ncbi:MAG TPA: VOC family protein [Bacillus sp. (in: firmicutes)]|nr:VOC family protein [Bacillus sp. (in: firmicutes)]
MSKDIFGVGIFIPVSDLDTSTNWYQNMFGFEILHKDEPEANVLKMGDGTVLFCLVKSTDITQPTFPKNNYDVDHYFNFHTNDVEKSYQNFLNKGANVSEIHEYDGIRGFSLFDPDGNRFGVVK